MLTRLTFADWRVIGHYLGALVILMGCIMLVPFVMAIGFSEYDAAVIFLKSIGITLSVGAALLLLRVGRGPMDRRQAFMVTSLSWVVLSLVGALPLWMSGHYSSFLDGFFEGVSCLTTTGMSVAVDLDHMALSLVTWRIILHLVGGIGVLVIALALGVFGSGSGAASIYQAEARDEHVMPEIKQTARFIAKVSGVVILVGACACFIPLLVAGVDPLPAALNAVWTAVSAYATGGMTGQSMGIMFFHSWALEIVALLIVFFGIINFALYGKLWNGQLKGFFKDIEVRTIAAWITVLTLLMMFALMSAGEYTRLGALLRRTLYTLVSAATNVGFNTAYAGQIMYVMGSGAFFVFILAMTMGGSAGSTTGGIKAFRVGIIIKTVTQNVREALAPDRTRARTFYYHQGERLLDPELAATSLTVFLLYVITFGIGAIAGIVYGYEALPSIFESVAVTSNAGLSAGIVNAGMPRGLEAVYIVQMWVGRLEFIAIFAMLLQLVVSFTPRAVAHRVSSRVARQRERRRSHWERFVLWFNRRREGEVTIEETMEGAAAARRRHRRDRDTATRRSRK